MDIENTKLVYFSPTGTTKTILENLAAGVGVSTVEHFDVTLPGTIQSGFPEMNSSDLLIIGAPVYAGRIPEIAGQRFQELRSNGSAAVIVVLYGNREFEDALVELADLATNAGFRPVAGGAFIGEHSFSSETSPIAGGRPDPADIGTAQEFGRKVADRLKRALNLEDIEIPDFPGNRPYRELVRLPPTSPVTENDLCTQCEACISVCPVSAISLRDAIDTNKEKCIMCCTCIRACPENARIFKDPFIKKIVEWLRTQAAERKEPEVFMIA
jgi:ferredoxin